MVILARHLMRHGIVGKGGKTEGGRYVDEFRAGEYIAAARVHLGMSTADAEALSSTELQELFEAKFPAEKRAADVPTRDEYEAGVIAMRAIQKAAVEKRRE
jgi:hypothetical protein